MIKIYHTGSTGNLYRVGNLLVEAGVPISRIKKALRHNFSDVSGCIVSHAHQDHGEAAGALAGFGVDVYMTEPTRATLGLSGHHVHVIQEAGQFKIGDWAVAAFPLVHDCDGHVGFLMARGREKIAYITDTHYCPVYCPVRFRGLTRLMIEANYDPDILRENVEAGIVPSAATYRAMRSHMSIDTAVEAIRANMNPALREIVLIHTSRTNGDPAAFKRRVEGLFGVPVKTR